MIGAIEKALIDESKCIDWRKYVYLPMYHYYTKIQLTVNDSICSLHILPLILK
jgi:hypothetical protein